jgi:hypothetical protein
VGAVEFSPQVTIKPAQLLPFDDSRCCIKSVKVGDLNVAGILSAFIRP